MARDKRIMIVGLGRFGIAMVDDLWEAGIDVVVLDTDEQAIDRIKDRSAAAFVGDATDPEVLQGVGAHEMDTVVVSFGRFFEATVLCVSALKELEVRHIVARAETPRQAHIIRTVGATRVVQLEHDMGKRLAHDLVAPVTQELIEFAEHYRVIPWSARGPLVGKTLGEAKLRQQYEIHVLGYRSHGEETPAGEKPRLNIPGPHYKIEEGDTLLLVGEEDSVTRFVAEVGED